jgi:hypothetical protein
MFRSESELLLQLQHTSPASARRHPQQSSSDVLLHIHVLLPLAGTWRVTAGLGMAMLQHIGDVVAVDCSDSHFDHVASRSQQVDDALHQAVAHAPVQPRLVLPEAFGSDDDEPQQGDLIKAREELKEKNELQKLHLEAEDQLRKHQYELHQLEAELTPPLVPAQSESHASVFDACGDVEGAEIEHVMWVQGGGVARSSASNSSREVDVYTHSGDLPPHYASRCSNRLWRDLTPLAGPTLSVAVLCPRVVADQQQLMTSRLLAPSSRVRGGSWMITTSPAPIMLLPENDVADEAARSFPSLVGPHGLGCGSADGRGSAFTGLFVGCAVICSHDETSFPSPWPLDITSRTSPRHSNPNVFCNLLLRLTRCSVGHGCAKRHSHATRRVAAWQERFARQQRLQQRHPWITQQEVGGKEQWRCCQCVCHDQPGRQRVQRASALSRYALGQPALFLCQFKSNFEHILLPFTLTAE